MFKFRKKTEAELERLKAAYKELCAECGEGEKARAELDARLKRIYVEFDEFRKEMKTITTRTTVPDDAPDAAQILREYLFGEEEDNG